ncbi:NAD-dependent protein deacetylase sirtuin-3, mitochondrial isoform X1 [Gasterosteus aculeatus]
MASSVSPSLRSPVRLSVYLCSRTSRTLSANGRLGQRRSCPGPGEGAALCRQTVSPRWNGTREFFSRGGSGGSAEGQKTLADIAEGIRERRYAKVVVMAGAGISTPSGIPDFRSPGSGLYDNLQQYDLPYAEAIFELRFFHHNPRPFFALAKELYPGNYRPNVTHYFVRLLHEKSQLLRMYTQNIDGLERLAGIPPEMLVEAHGTFATATCTVCLREHQGEELRADVMSGTVPQCPTCRGVVKPDIVFFGEELPRHFFKYLTDFPRADLLVVMGTSLEVSRACGAVRQSGRSGGRLRSPSAHQPGPGGSVRRAPPRPRRGATGRRGRRRASPGRRARLDPRAGRSDGRRCSESCNKDGRVTIFSNQTGGLISFSQPDEKTA